VSRPLIGIPAQTLQAIDDIPAGLPHSWVMNTRYFAAAAEAGAAPVMIPLFVEDHDILREVYDRLDGVLLAGGVDMHPLTYGEHPHPRLGRTDPARDVVELALAQWAITERKPILGLCRGAQVLNVVLGGTLWQDIGSQVPTAIKHDCFPNEGYERDYLAHEVAITPGSRLDASFEVSSVPVNSMHHQAVKTLAPGLHASAHSPDGMVEAIESGTDHFLVGVQWHPEIFEHRDERTRRLFQSFVDSCRGVR